MAAPLPPQTGLFDIPAEVSYLNTAYMGPLPRASVEAGLDALRRKARPWSLTVDDFFEPVERLRAVVANLIGGDADGVAITPSVSYGMATAAANLPVGPGRTVVVVEGQFPSNVYAWRQAAARDGGEVRTVPRPADVDMTSALIEAIDERTAVAAVAPCHWADGAMVDLPAVCRRAREVGAAVVLDVCQWAGAAPLDVSGLGVTFAAGAFYKWLLGPYGLGFCWVAPEHRDRTPIEFGWMARADSHRFAELVDYRDEYREGARRFDMGEVSSFTQVATALASSGLVAGWGVDRVAAANQRLVGLVAEGAARLGLRSVPPHERSPHIIGLRMPEGSDPEMVAGHLQRALVHVSVRGTAVRVAPHVYNTAGNVDHLVAALEAALASGR